MLISDAFNSYALDVIAMKNQSAKTEENHYVCMRALLSYFGDIDLTALSFTMVRDWKLALDKHRSPATVRNYIIKLRNVLTYLQKHGIACLDPEQIPIPQRRNSVPTYLSANEVARCILVTRRVKNKAIVSLLYASGIRVAELCNLDRDQLQQQSFTIVGKGGKARLCFYDERTAYLLSEYFATRTDNHTAAFLTEAGLRISPGTIQETFKSIRRQTGLEVHPHTLRHSFATNLLQNNTNLFHVSKMLGHAQLNTTATYLHVIDPELEAIYKKHHTI